MVGWGAGGVCPLNGAVSCCDLLRRLSHSVYIGREFGVPVVKALQIGGVLKRWRLGVSSSALDVVSDITGSNFTYFRMMQY